MKTIVADASLPGLDAFFCESFILKRYHDPKELHQHIQTSDILLCRATLKVDEKLLANSAIQMVASATSGIDHLDTDYLKSKGIRWFDAKGSNAEAVADYVLSCVAYLEHNNYLSTSKAGVVGLGEVGGRVYKRLKSIGYDVVAFDPLIGKAPNNQNLLDFDALFDCDVLCIHANLHKTVPYPSFNLFNESVLSKLKSGTVVINAARGGIVNELALVNNNHPLIYCTDVYANEPDIMPALVDYATLCTPHIAGHSIEAKYEAVYQISVQLHQHFQLPIPPHHQPEMLLDPIKPSKTWQDSALSIYNPMIETKALKAHQTFSSLRKAHTFRHQFSSLDLSRLSERQKRLIIGS
jgi:erythronate-4-phosphate dehydrogenase